MISVAIGVFIGGVLGGLVYEKFIKEEEEIKVEHKHEYHITSSEKNADVSEIASKIKEKLEQSSK